MTEASFYKVRSWRATTDQEVYLRTIEPTRDFLHNLPDETRAAHAGQWVAAKDCQIVATASTMAELCAKLPDPNDPHVLMLRLEQGLSVRWRHC